ncbi:MAG TPA: tetratricopeptide repeat protein [Terriglobales bacterium]
MKYQGKIVAVMVLSVTALTWSGCNRNPHLQAEKHFASAQDWLRQGKPEEAAIELRSAIQLDPRFAKAHFEFAKLQLKKGEVVSAFQSLQLAVKYDPENREANENIAEILLRGGRLTDARTKAEAILVKWPGDAAAELVLAESEIGLGDDRRAREILDKLLKDDGKNSRAVFDLAAINFKSHDLDSSIANLRRAWELTPDNIVAPLILSRVYEGRKDFAQAVAILEEALRRKPDNLQLHYAIAGVYLRNNHPDQAEAYLRKIQQLGSNDPRHRAVIAQFYTILNRLPEAEAEYKRLLAEKPNDSITGRGLAELYVGMGRRDEAKTIADKLVKQAPQDWESQTLRGRLDLLEGNADQALVRFERAQKINPDAAPVYFNIAQAYLKQGNMDGAKTTLQEAVRRQPSFPAAWLLLSELAMRTGDVDRAIEDLNSAQSEHRLPPLEANLLLSQAYAMKGELDRADETLSNLMEAKAAQQQRALILYNLGWIRLKRGRSAEAAKLAVSALQADAKSEQALYLLGLSYLAQRQPERAISVVDSYVQKDQNWGPGFDTLGKIALQSGKLDVAEQAFNRALQLQPDSFSASMGLAETYAGSKQIEQAIAAYENLQKRSPDTAFIPLRIGLLEEASGDWQKAQEAYRRSISLESNNPTAKNNLAWIYVQHDGNLDLALRLAQEAKEAAPQDPRIADTLGWIFTKKGAYDMAADNFKQSLEKNPKSPTYLYHLGFAYYKMGRLSDAREELTAALSNPNFSSAAEARALLATIPGN